MLWEGPSRSRSSWPAPLSQRTTHALCRHIDRPGPGRPDRTALSAARHALAALGSDPAAPEWLAEGEAADLVFEDLDPDQADAAIRHALNGQSIDCIAQPIENRRKKLLIADMKSTIIEQEMLDEIAELKGIKPQIADITARAMNGEIDFIGALNERVALLAGLPENAINGLSAALPSRRARRPWSRRCAPPGRGPCWCRRLHDLRRPRCRHQLRPGGAMSSFPAQHQCSDGERRAADPRPFGQAGEVDQPVRPASYRVDRNHRRRRRGKRCADAAGGVGRRVTHQTRHKEGGDGADRYAGLAALLYARLRGGDHKLTLKISP